MSEYHLIGTDAILDADLIGDDGVTYLTPSDHFGLVIKFDLLDPIKVDSSSLSLNNGNLMASSTSSKEPSLVGEPDRQKELTFSDLLVLEEGDRESSSQRSNVKRKVSSVQADEESEKVERKTTNKKQKIIPTQEIIDLT
jgi:hypothetical protein